MRSRPWWKYVALLLLVGLMFPGAAIVAAALGEAADEEEAAEQRAQDQCAVISTRLATALQGYVDEFAGVEALQAQDLPPLPDVAQLRAEAADVRQEIGRTECDAEDFEEAAAAALRKMEAEGVLARAVKDVFTANVIDVLGPGARQDRVVMAQDDDLADTLSDLPLGSTLVVPEGEYQLDEPLTVLQDLRIEGAGADRTRITSSAEEVAVLLTAPARLQMTGLAVEHEGDAPASLLMMRAGHTELVDVHLSGAVAAGPRPDSGATAPDIASGGNGVVAASGETLRLRNTTVDGNRAGGVVVAGTVTTQISGSRIVGNGGCGLCYLGSSGGTVRDTAVSGNSVGLISGDRTRPVVRSSALVDNRNAGVVVQRRARPVLSGNEVRGNGPLGVAAYERSSPRVVGNEVSGHAEAGLILDVLATAAPRITANNFTDNAQASLVFLGASRGEARENRCGGGRFDLVLDGTSDPRLSGNRCELHDQR